MSMGFFAQEVRAQLVLGIKGEIASSSSFNGCQAGGAVTVGKQMKIASIMADFGHTQSNTYVDLTFLLRIYGNEGHSINMYMGAGLTAGVWSPEENGNVFIAGVFPAVQAETFITRRISLYADVRTPFMFLSDGGELTARYSLGIRYLLYKEAKL